MEIRAPSPDQVDGLEGLVCGQVREGAGSDRFAISSHFQPAQSQGWLKPFFAHAPSTSGSGDAGGERRWSIALPSVEQRPQHSGILIWSDRSSWMSFGHVSMPPSSTKVGRAATNASQGHLFFGSKEAAKRYKRRLITLIFADRVKVTRRHGHDPSGAGLILVAWIVTQCAPRVLLLHASLDRLQSLSARVLVTRCRCHAPANGFRN